MRFLPLTREIQLEESNPEKLIEASKGAYFYRSGNDIFYTIDNNGKRNRILLPRKSFALKYHNKPWYETIVDELIVFENTYELWKKTGSGYNSKGWTFISNRTLNSVQNPDVTLFTTPTPTPTETPTATPVPPTPTPTPTPTETPVAPTPTPTPSDSPAILSTTGGSADLLGGYCIGWEFSVTQSYVVTKLGWWDADGLGLAATHSVALYTDGGTLLRSGSVSPNSELIGQYRYGVIPEYILNTGSKYVVVGNLDYDSFLGYCTSVTMSVGLTWHRGLYTPTTSTLPALTFPTIGSDRDISYFGPNMILSTI
jgi:hypothetical protein